MSNNRNNGSNTRRGNNNYFGDSPRVRTYSRKNDSTHGGHGGGAKRRRSLPLALAILIDVLIGALILLIFYVTNYMIKTEIEATPLPTPTSTVGIVAPTADASGQVTGAPTGTQQSQTPAVDPNDWRAKFADKFTDGPVEQTENSYKSANINVSIEKVQKNGAVYYFADIYIAELKYFKSAFPVKSDVMGNRELTDKVAQENNAIIAINGDHCVDNPGTVVRNGKLFREDTVSNDMLVMNYDGSMQAYSPDAFDVDKIKAEGAYQVWTFGPMLLENGQPMTQFNSGVTGQKPQDRHRIL